MSLKVFDTFIPDDENSTYPLLDTKHIKGGFTTVELKSELEQIIDEKRKELVYCYEDGKMYLWNKTSYQELVLSSSNIKFTELTPQTSYSIGDVVIYQNDLYTIKQEFMTTDNIDTDVTGNPQVFEKLLDNSLVIRNTDIEATAATDEHVYSALAIKTLLESLKGSVSSLKVKEYAPSVEYKKFELVYNSVSFELYIATADFTSTDAWETDKGNLLLIGPIEDIGNADLSKAIQIYDAVNNYKVNDIVFDIGTSAFYKVLQATNNTTITDDTYFLNLELSGNGGGEVPIREIQLNQTPVPPENGVVKLSINLDTVEGLNDKITELENSLTSVFNFKGKKPLTSDITSIQDAALGDVWYCEEDSFFYFYDGAQWVSFTPQIVAQDASVVKKLSATTSYTAGEYVYYSGCLYVVKQELTTSADIITDIADTTKFELVVGDGIVVHKEISIADSILIAPKSSQLVTLDESTEYKADSNGFISLLSGGITNLLVSPCIFTAGALQVFATNDTNSTVELSGSKIAINLYNGQTSGINLNLNDTANISHNGENLKDVINGLQTPADTKEVYYDLSGTELEIGKIKLADGTEKALYRKYIAKDITLQEDTEYTEEAIETLTGCKIVNIFGEKVLQLDGTVYQKLPFDNGDTTLLRLLYNTATSEIKLGHKGILTLQPYGFNKIELCVEYYKEA